MKNMTLRSIVLAMGVFLAGQAFAQIHENVPPKSFALDQSTTTSMQRQGSKSVQLPDLDNAAEQANAKKTLADCKSCKKDFYGRPLPMELDLKRDGQLTNVDGGRIWTLNVYSTTAKALQFYFSRYEVPKGATLHLYNADHSALLGAFTKRNINPDFKFVTQIFPGNQAVLEYFEPDHAEFAGTLKVDKVIHVFKDTFSSSAERSGGFGVSGSCNVDVNCSAGSVLSDVKKGVGMISYLDQTTGLTALCTGFLINSTASNAFKPPYFMTAGHCVGGVKQYGYYFDYIFYFNYENAGCADDTTNPLLRADAFQGAYLRSLGQDGLTVTDYALLELYDRPENWASVTYLGWDKRSTAPAGGTFNISHPKGDAKKIAIDHQPPVSVTQMVTACLESGDLQGWQVDWNQGVTEPSSSGSPLLNGSKRVIGMLKGGDSRCSDSEGTDFCKNTAAKSGPDWYARMDYAWNHANPGHTELSFYLDPGNTNQEYIDAYFPPSAPSGYVKINAITTTSTHWEDGPKLVPQITNTSNAGTLRYSWSPAADIYNPAEGVAILYYGGQRPNLPLTKTYTLTVTSTAGFTDTRSIAVTLYDCENKTVLKDVCSSKSVKIGYTQKTGETYSWSPSTGLSSSSVSDPVLTPTGPGEFTYVLTVTSPECTRVETYKITSLDPPIPPVFVPRKVADARFGSATNEEAMALRKIGANKLGLVGISDHLYPVNGDHVDETRYTEFSAEFMFFDLDLNLNKQRNFSVDRSLYRINVDFDNNTSGYFFVNHKGVRKTDLTGNTLWFYNGSGTGDTDEFRPVDLNAFPDGVIMSANRYAYYGFTRSLLHKIDNGGNLISSKYFDEPILAVSRAVDGTMFVIFEGSVPSPGKRNYRIQKMSETFAPIWSYTTAEGTPGFIKQIILATNDGGCIFGNWRYDDDNNPNNGNYDKDMYALKISSTGSKQWEKKIRGNHDDVLASIIKTSDSGFILAGYSDSNIGGDKTENSRGYTDFWIVKLDHNGRVIGDKTIGGSSSEVLRSILQVDDATFFLAGDSGSGISGDRSQASYGSWDLWVVKLIDDESLPDNSTNEKVICESFNAGFNNYSTPFIDKKIILGCATPVVINSGATVRARASEQIVVKPGVTLKSGSTVVLQASSSPTHPCNDDNAGGRMETEDESTANNNETIFADAEIYVAPNPTTGLCKVHFAEGIEPPFRLSVLNSVGQSLLRDEVTTLSNNMYEFDVSPYATGIFFIKVESANGIKLSKFVKE